MAELTNDSILGRLLEEISWEKATKYRAGGRGMENVLTAEVFTPLDYLPRSQFLGEVLLRSHGADDARSVIASEIEEARFRLLPDEVLIGTEKAKVQPDGFLESTNSLVLLEAKRIRSSSFQNQQLAREVIALLENAGARRPLLFLILGSPPPVRIDGLGHLDPAEAVAATIAEAIAATGATGIAAEQVISVIDSMLAWTTWDEIRDVVVQQSGEIGWPPGLDGTVRRLVDALKAAVEWHA